MGLLLLSSPFAFCYIRRFGKDFSELTSPGRDDDDPSSAGMMSLSGLLSSLLFRHSPLHPLPLATATTCLQARQASWKRHRHPPPPLTSSDPARHPRDGPAEVAKGPLGTLTGATEDVFGWIPPHRFTRGRRNRMKKADTFGPDKFKGAPVQDWQSYDGFGPYKYRHHSFPNNKTANDWMKRKVFVEHSEHRARVNAVRKAGDILPKELVRMADEEIHEIPRNSAITRLNRRCVISGR